MLHMKRGQYRCGSCLGYSERRKMGLRLGQKDEVDEETKDEKEAGQKDDDILKA